MVVYTRLVPAAGLQRRRAYPSDLTDAQWTVLDPLLREPAGEGPGRPPTVARREVVNALLYMKRKCSVPLRCRE
jgi:hypothetical protein